MASGAGSSGGSAVEIEWQFDAPDMPPVERWLAGINGIATGSGGPNQALTTVSRRAKRQIDTYLDTEDWRTGRAGYVLRVRRGTNPGEVTLKSRAPSNAGLRTREEITEALPADGIDALGADGPVGRRLRSLTGGRPLRPVIQVRTTRRPYDLKIDGETVAEVALDDTVVSAGYVHLPTRLRRVEVEVVPAWVERLTPLVEHLERSCGLRPAALSKFEAGLLAAGLEIPGPPDFGPTQVTGVSTVADVAYAVLRKNLVAMLAHEPGTRLGDDPEDLHDMRVATRRMRAAFALFKDALPAPAEGLRAEVGWLGGELGRVRDLDVQLERLEGWAREVSDQDRAALDDLTGLLGQERDQARAELLSGLDSERYEQLVAGLGDVLRRGPSGDSGAELAVAVVPDLVEGRHRAATKAARRAGRTKAAEDFHRLRIRCKRLRYALEFVADLYDGRTRPMVRRVQNLQDRLGRMQDARVAVDRLHGLATAPSSGLSPTTVFVIGGVAERYRRESRQIAASLPAKLERLGGGRWRKLRAVMEHRRPHLDAPYGWSLPLHPPAPDDTAGPAGTETPGASPVATTAPRVAATPDPDTGSG